MHVEGTKSGDGIPHMIHLFGFFVRLEVAQLLPPGRRRGHDALFRNALLGRAPLRGRLY